MYKFLFGSSFLILFITLYNFGYSQNANTEDLIYSPEQMPYNKTFADWAVWWWNQHLSIPDIKQNNSLAHPRDNYSPEKCSWAQDNGPVWFLPDGKDQTDITNAEVRECKVPQGKAMLVQIVGSGCSMGEGYKDQQGIRDCAVWVLPTAEFSAKIDGKEVMNTKNNPGDKQKFYVEPYEANLTYVKNSYYGKVLPGTYEGEVAGYYLFIKPLPTGKHEIEFDESAIEYLNNFPISQRLSHVKYLITIE